VRCWAGQQQRQEYPDEGFCCHVAKVLQTRRWGTCGPRPTQPGLLLRMVRAAKAQLFATCISLTGRRTCFDW
jgi:hypothetical protein